MFFFQIFRILQIKYKALCIESFKKTNFHINNLTGKPIFEIKSKTVGIFFQAQLSCRHGPRSQLSFPLYFHNFHLSCVWQLTSFMHDEYVFYLNYKKSDKNDFNSKKYEQENIIFKLLYVSVIVLVYPYVFGGIMKWNF